MKRHAPAALAARLFVFRRASSLALVALVLAGCTSRSAADAPPAADVSIAECDAYVASLSNCLTRAGATATTVEAREAVAARFATAAKGDEATRERFRLKCAEGQKVLASTCR